MDGYVAGEDGEVPEGDAGGGTAPTNPIISMSPAYLSVVPGRASWGHDQQGQGPARGGVAVFLVDDLTSTSTSGLDS